MRKLREVLRQKLDCKLSDRDVAKSCCISRSSVSKYIQRAKAAGLTWPLPEEMTDDELERLLIRSSIPDFEGVKPIPDWFEIHKSLKKKGMTLQLLWEEYKEEHPKGLQYSQFCHRFREWRKLSDLPMHQNHKAGEKMFVDYCGLTMTVNENGKVRQVEIFVAVLGASNYTFASGYFSQSLPEWIAAHAHAFQYFGGVPALIIPDNLKSGVSTPHYYEPEINPTYKDLARHYGCAIVPARVARPKDKAKVEKGVQDVERRIISPLRNRTFFSLQELNEAVAELLSRHNNRPFQKMPGSRRSLFEEVERSALKPLPITPYEYSEWKKARVNIDYHVDVDHHYYSVPYQLVNQTLDIRITRTSIECFHKNKRVSSHLRSSHKGQYSTTIDHMPRRHQDYAKWTPERLVRWAEKTGQNTIAVVEKILTSRPHPQQGFRACLGLMRLGKEYGPDRLEAACIRALAINSVSFKSIDSILKRSLDKQQLPQKQEEKPPIKHENIRGPEYYKD